MRSWRWGEEGVGAGVMNVVVTLVLAFMNVLDICTRSAGIDRIHGISTFSSVRVASIKAVCFARDSACSFGVRNGRGRIGGARAAIGSNYLLVNFGSEGGGDVEGRGSNIAV